MFKEISIFDAGLFGFLNDGGKIETSKIDPNIFKPQFKEPTWNQINYYLYKLDSTGFHDEIYSNIEENYGNAETYIYSRTNQKVSYIEKDKTGNPKPAINISLSTYVRHQIHHSDNLFNPRFTERQLHDSIVELLSLI
jgi:hypothetical protein